MSDSSLPTPLAQDTPSGGVQIPTTEPVRIESSAGFSEPTPQVPASASPVVLPDDAGTSVPDAPVDGVIQLDELGAASVAPTVPPPVMQAPAVPPVEGAPSPLSPPAAQTPAESGFQQGVLPQPPASGQPPQGALPEIEEVPTDSTQQPTAPEDQPTEPTTDQLPQPPQSQQSTDGKSFGSLLDVLVDMGALSQEQVSKLLVENINTGERIETLIEKQNLTSEENLARAKATFYHTPFVKLSETGIFPEALNQLPEGVARHYAMLPFAFDKSDRTLSVAMKNPLDLSAIDFAEQKTGLRLIVHFAMPSELERMIAEYYSQTLSSEVSAALEQTTQMAEAKKKKEDLSNLSGETIRQAPITKIVQTVLAFAMKARASDIHIEPLEDRTRVRYRIDGILNEKLILPSTVHDAVVSRIKILSGLKIDEKRLPQDGRFNFATNEQEVDLRVSTLPTIHGEKVVMRLLKKDQSVPSLPELGLTGLALRNVETAIKVPHGIILVTGPTGSGKTTTLYSILHKINTPKVNIMTLEDPVEYQMTGINQVQINPQAGLSFASGLRSFLRQDPNIIMVGEIRDSETAELAVQASLTGHLVFSTLHTSSAAGAIPRMMDMGAEPFLLASSMTLVMAQRVVRQVNQQFKEEYKPEPEVIEDIQKVLGDRFTAWCKQNNKRPEDIMLVRPKKDRPQTEPEYKGRVGIFEVMKVSEELSRMILERKPAQELEKRAIQEGMFLMKQDGYMKVLEGVTTIEEVLRVAQI